MKVTMLFLIGAWTGSPTNNGKMWNLKIKNGMLHKHEGNQYCTGGEKGKAQNHQEYTFILQIFISSGKMGQSFLYTTGHFPLNQDSGMEEHNLYVCWYCIYVGILIFVSVTISPHYPNREYQKNVVAASEKCKKKQNSFTFALLTSFKHPF